MSKIAFVFPGQGAQYVGMGKEFFENFSIARHTYEESSDEIKLDLAKLCFEGPEEELLKTENTQPAILATSIAILRVLEEEGFNCTMTAGLSLGEYTSLVKANVLSFKDAISLVKKRGRYMQEEVPTGIGAMAAILGLNREQLELCIENSKEYGIVEAANYNSPGQIVISGEVKAVEHTINLCKEMGARRAVILPVSAPFHSSLIKGAGEKLRKDLEEICINDPQVTVISNVNAEILTSKSEVIPTLVRQVSSSVLWEDSINLMLDKGVNTFIEIGPGKTLSSFIKRIAKNNKKTVNTYNVEDLNGLKEISKLKKEG